MNNGIMQAIAALTLATVAQSIEDARDIPRETSDRLLGPERTGDLNRIAEPSRDPVAQRIRAEREARKAANFVRQKKARS